ncbi:MAG: hypothetical protein R2941_06400 [Desulfobacterales bacterium]
MIKPVFVDTSALIAIGDGMFFYCQAITVKDYLKKSKRDFVTTGAILLEFEMHSVLSVSSLLCTKLIEVDSQRSGKTVVIDEKLIQRGLTCRQMKDKEWGLLTVPLLLQEIWELQKIFTADHHFEQAGFTILLKKNT